MPFYFKMYSTYDCVHRTVTHVMDTNTVTSRYNAVMMCMSAFQVTLTLRTLSVWKVNIKFGDDFDLGYFSSENVAQLL